MVKWMYEVLTINIAEKSMSDEYIIVEASWELSLECVDYADDVVPMIKGKFEETLFDLFPKGLTVIEQWCLSVRLNLNPTKTTVVPFTQKRNPSAMVTLSLNGNILEWKSELKYLRITKRLWNEHILLLQVELQRL